MRTVLVYLALACLPRLLAAQGVTTAALEGVVRAEGGSPIHGVTVQIVNASNGRRWEVVTQGGGRYGLEEVAIGGPYRIEARALGFTTVATDGIWLTLGQRLVVDFTLRPAAIELPELVVTASAHAVLDPGRTGPAEVISRATIAALPNPNRDFFTLTLLSPHARFSPPTGGAPSGGISVGGQNRLYNSFQIDGGANHDLYRGRLPGSETLPRPISLEAVEEIQVLVSPFDVRHGAFAGGLVNAVTKSGSNAVQGSLFAFLTNGALVRRGPGGVPSDFAAWQYGGWIGGPIVRDRAHYFLSLDLQRRVVPDGRALMTDPACETEIQCIGISHASAVRFQDILRNRYGLDPGSLGPLDERAPAQDVFGKITVHLGTNSHLEVSHHYAHGDRRPRLVRRFGFYELSSAATQNPATIQTSRLIWTHRLDGRWSNQLIVSHLRSRDQCRPSAGYPRIDVVAEQGFLVVGPPLGCPGAGIEQNALEITENVNVGLGSHRLSFGPHGGWFHFKDGAAGLSAGWWSFRNLDSLEAGRAYHHERTLPGPSGGERVEFRMWRLGAYLQDRWSATPDLVLTAGLRVDAHVLADAVPTNEALQVALGIDTGRLPSPSVAWSPRFGFNYDVRGEGRSFLRGGVGLFAGPPPYRWLGNAYRDDGTRMLFLICDGAQVPPFDPISQPTTCGAGPTPRLSFLDSDLKLPQNLKVALGLDHALPGGWIATIDFLHTRSMHQLYVSDANLLPPSGVGSGEGARALYGTIDSNGAPRPSRVDGALGQVVRVSNVSGDRAWSLSAQLRKRFGSGGEVSGLYAFGRARDRMSVLALAPRPNLTGTPLDGTLEERRLTTSFFETPHRVVVQATIPLPYRMRLSLLYAGASGTPFTYLINGDANADGIGRGAIKNDIVYVPRDSLDIALADPADWPSLDAYIEAERCLREQRGRILKRNSCRNPWFGALNARLTKAMPTVKGQSLEVSVDVYNVLNLLQRRWGQSRATTLSPWVTMLRLVGYDTAAGRGIYEVTLPARNQVQDPASRWQIELSARYLF